MATYCEYCNSHPEDTFNRAYHDTQYGFPLKDDNLLFERLILEINQAGLSWLTILKKRAAFRAAYSGFSVDAVARFDSRRRAKLLADAGIIRNRLKIDAAIENAKRIRGLRKTHGSFAQWLELNHPLEKDDWVRLVRRTCVFTGGEITGSFLLSTGYLPGAHEEGCPVYEKTIDAGAAWARS